MTQLKTAFDILKEIESTGYEAYIVGGAVRDILFNIPVHDIDIATNHPNICDIFETYDIGKSKDFGICVVNRNGHSFEIANFRSDSNYTDGRRPDHISIETSFEKDCQRRDFTINGLGINSQDKIIDHVSGIHDIRNRTLRAIGDPKKRFQEDYLRILRAPRFVAKFGLSIELETLQAITDNKEKISLMSPERIKDELFKAASHHSFVNYLIALDILEILPIILPEIDAMKQWPHFESHHPEGGVFAHTLSSLRVAKSNNPLVNLGILFHDIGKPVSNQPKEDGYSYHGHEDEGEKLFRETIAPRLKFSNKEIETISFCIKNHMKFHLIEELKPSKIFRLVSNENWDYLIEVAKADNYSRGESFKHHFNYDKMITKANEVKDKYFQEKPVKLVDGFKVMELTGLPPGRDVGTIIKRVTEWVIDNGIDLNNETIINNRIIFEYFRRIE